MSTNETSLIESVPTDTYLVGIGASAGGVEALKAFVATLPDTDRASYVVAQHLSPTHKSCLADILKRETTLEVRELQNHVRPRPGVIYIVPANFDVVCISGYLHLSDSESERKPKPSIDRFFISLAKDRTSRAIGVVLSGTGSDGSAGVRAIRSHGGYTFAQDLDSAKYSGMPMSAINTGAVDWVLPLKDIAAEVNKLITQAGGGAEAGIKVESLDQTEMFRELLRGLQRATQINFSGYKQATLVRRIERRMNATKSSTFAEYVEYTRNFPRELNALAQDILISVTEFFRDKATFQRLAHYAREDISKLQAGDLYRVWVTACASGEEAYTIALILEELRSEFGRRFDYKIFATDLDVTALEIAKSGVYSRALLDAVPTAMRDRYFEIWNDKYKIVPEIRNKIVFARHDLIKDPPFKSVDLVSCRNVLIYFDKAVQAAVLQKLHYVLKPNGILVLGMSEGIHQSEDFFDPLDTHAKIFRRRNVPASLANLPLETLQSLTEYKHNTREWRRSSKRVPDRFQAIRQWQLERYVPPSLIVDKDYRVLHSQGDLGAYVSFPSGEFDAKLDKVLHSELISDALALLFRAKAHNQPVHTVVRPTDDKASVDLSAKFFVSEDLEPYYLLTFEKVTPIVVEPPVVGSRDDVVPREVYEQVRHELAGTKEQLEAVMEEHRTSMEEMNSLAEELQAANEELQSSNEELESSTEELQSTNEELITVNEELEAKTEELSSTNRRLTHIQNSLGYPFVVFSGDGTVQQFNDLAKHHFGFSAASVGQAFTSTYRGKDFALLGRVVTQVIETNTPIEETIESGGRWYHLRAIPLEPTEHGQRSGVVVALWDTTDLVKTARAATASRMELQAVLDHSLSLITKKDVVGRYLYVNATFERIMQIAAQDCIGKTDDQLFGAQITAVWRDAELAIARSGKAQVTEECLPLPGGQRWFLTVRYPLFAPDNVVESIATKAIDITELKATQQDLAALKSALEPANAIYRGIIEGAPDLIIAVDVQYKIMAFNKPYAQLLEKIYGTKFQLGDNILDIYKDRSAGEQEFARNLWDRALKGEHFIEEHEISFVNDRRVFEIAGSSIRNNEGVVIGAVMNVRDITQRKATELKLAESERHYRILIDDTDLACVTLDRAGRVLDANPEYLRLAGVSRLADIATRPITDWTHPEDRELEQRSIETCLKDGSIRNLQVRYVDRGQRTIPIEMNAAVGHKDGEPVVLAWCRDITERVVEREHMERMAFNDPLTGLDNRAVFSEKLKNIVSQAERNHSRFALLFVDLDRFKGINDSLGHDVGDELLKAVAARLKSAVREGDVVGRQGGDEFLVILLNTPNKPAVTRAARQMLHVLNAPYSIGDHVLELSASIGISRYPDDGRNARQLIKAADDAMYETKKQGRAGFTFYRQGMDPSNELGLDAEDLLRAVEKGELQVVYQPQVSLATGRIVGAEALLRWNHRDRGQILPDKFIALAENTGLVSKLGNWVLGEVCNNASAWSRKGIDPVRVAVNVSPRQCRDSRLQDEVSRCLSSSGLRSEFLELEFTESVLLESSAATDTMLQTLRSMNVGLVIDDFGTGYASLAYLKRFPMHKIKIDMSFVRDIGRDKDDEAIVRAIIQMGHSLGRKVIAEGVENRAQLDFLRTHGCDEVQGFYLSEPISSELFVTLLQERPVLFEAQGGG